MVLGAPGRESSLKPPLVFRRFRRQQRLVSGSRDQSVNLWQVTPNGLRSISAVSAARPSGGGGLCFFFFWGG